MEVVTGATSTLLPKLGALLQEEYILQKKVRKDVESLQKELIFMRAALCKVAEVPPEQLDEQVKAWASNVKELSYDMEDAVDTFKVRVAVNGIADQQDHILAINLVEMFKKAKARHELADVIEEMKGLTVQVAELRDRYKLDYIASCEQPVTTESAHDINVSRNYQLWTWWRHRGDISSQITDLKVEAQHSGVENSATGFEVVCSQQEIPGLIDMKEPVGVGNDMEKLGEWVTCQDKTEGVLYIVGVQGIGKSTVGTALYRRFGDQFDRRATVTVSQSSDVDAILTSILSQVMPQFNSHDEQQGSNAGGALEKRGLKAAVNRMLPPRLKHKGRQHHQTHGSSRGHGTSEASPINAPQQDCSPSGQLKAHLEKHSYLLLIDDVWSEKTWEKIRGLLPQPTHKRKRRIIVTTRFPAVATACKKGGGDEIHRMEVLDERQNKEIFMEALSESRSARKDGEQKQMAIIPPRLWEMCGDQPLAIVTMAGHVACNPDKSVDGWKQVCNKLVPDSVKALTQDGVPRIISHCYNDMPAEIKTCSLYLSMYPKGCKISRKHMTRRWIAEGFVSEMQGRSVEDVAEAYFSHLIRRKIVQPVEQSSNGKVKNCQVYDLVLEYIVSKASEENLVTVVGGYWPLLPPSGRVRRLSLSLQGGDPGSFGHENATKNMNLSHVRTLAVFGGLNRLPSNSLDSPIVQVLDLEGCEDVQRQHMKAICKMLLLKYLSLRRTSIHVLPRDIGNLRNLETLDVRETNVAELPNTVWQLERLVSILGGNKRRRKALKLPVNMKKKPMRALRVLSGIEIIDEPSTVADLQRLTNLRKLAIYKLNVIKTTDLKSLIEYLGRNSLHTLVIIDDESSRFLESLDDLSSSSKFLTALELSGRLVKLPTWIKELVALTKLTLPITALRADALKDLSRLSSLFSLTFSLTAAKQAQETGAILERNKADSHGEIFVPADGFHNLKLLRFSAPCVPLLTFLEKAMPNLERLELRFSMLEGLYGIENLAMLKEVNVRVHEKADRFTTSIVKNMANAARKDDKGLRVIVDQYHG